MVKYILFLLAALPLAAASMEETRESGDVLIIEEAGEPDPPPARSVPTRGMDMANVRNVYGEPRQEHAEVGDPPITRWDYDGFSVFFEHDKVIHAVITD